MGSRQSAQQRIVSHSVDLFAGGMDSDASPYTVKEGQAIIGENVEFYRDNTLRSRRGYTQHTAATKSGSFITHRIGNVVQNVFKNGGSYYSDKGGVITNLGAVTGNTHSFVKLYNAALIVEPTRILQLDSNGLHTAAVDVPVALTGSSTGGGQLKEGTYTYLYNYLLTGGIESAQSPEYKLFVPDNGKVVLNIPTPAPHPSLFKLRIYRQDPDGGYPLLVKELDVGTATYEDKGDLQSALLPIQGIRNLPGGNLAVINNRRLFVVSGDTLNYSYPGNYAYGNVFWSEKLNLPTGENITAICPLGQGLILFGLETALYMNGVPSEGGSFNPIPIPDGCVGQTAWTLAEDGTLLYVGKSGLYAMNGATAQRISNPVNNYFTKYSLGELKNTTVIFDQQYRRIMVALPNEILVYFFETKAWAVWTLSGTTLDWFEGSIYMHINNHFAVFGETNTDNGQPITGRFVSGLHGLEDSVTHKLFRRIGLQVSAGPADIVDMSVIAVNYNSSYTGLPDRRTDALGAQWDVNLWDSGRWGGNVDTTQTVSLPDSIQGRYIQFAITFTTYDAASFVLMGPIVIEYRQRYRYGRS